MNRSNRRYAPITINEKISRLSICAAVFAMAIFICSLVFSNNKSGSVTASKDVTPPEIIGAQDINIYVGEAPAYRKGVVVSDNSGADVSLTIDSSAARISEPGWYPITYIATDTSGNSTSVTVYLTVELYFPREEELNQALDNVIAQIILPGMTTEDKLRAIYYYVQGNIAFVDTSDKTNWKAEAYKALFVSNTGDCFSFFAASKAFLERLGIENLDIQRPEELAKQMNQTHYWSLVNIGDGDEERWYHFDSCRLRAEYNHSGCLLTEVQIEAYNCVRENFYAYEKDKYPVVCKTIITPTPELEKFYN